MKTVRLTKQTKYQGCLCFTSNVVIRCYPLFVASTIHLDSPHDKYSVELNTSLYVVYLYIPTVYLFATE